MTASVRRFAPLATAELDRLATSRLLAHRSKPLRLESAASRSDLTDGEVAALEPGFLYWKDSSAWLAQHDR